MDASFPAAGGCDCRQVRYFVLDAMIEADRVTLPAGEPVVIDAPAESGQGQKIARCPHCWVALWPPGTPAMPQYDEREQLRPAESLARRAPPLAG